LLKLLLTACWCCLGKAICTWRRGSADT